MFSQRVLIAETDPHTLDVLPGLLSLHIPHVAIEQCTSEDALSLKLRDSSYDTVAINPRLLRVYRILKHQRVLHSFPPLLVTASQAERPAAFPALNHALEGDAFDLIVKPIVPHQAVQTVKLALWHHGLLRLLASRDRAVSRFRQHMAAFPHAVEAEAEFTMKMAAFERTLQAINSSLTHLLNIEEESSFLDMAASMERLTKKRALERLLSMGGEGTIH